MRRGSIVALLGLALIAGGVATAVALVPTWLPEDASQQAGRIAFTFWFVIAICIFIFAIVAAVMVYAVMHFRVREDDFEDGPPIHGHTGLEITWTIIPFLIVTAIAIVSAIVLSRNDAQAKDTLRVNVVAQQFEFTFSYPDAKNVTSPVLMLPKGRSVELYMRSSTSSTRSSCRSSRSRRTSSPGSSRSCTSRPHASARSRSSAQSSAASGTRSCAARPSSWSPAAFDAWLKKQEKAAGAAAGGTSTTSTTSTSTTSSTTPISPAQAGLTVFNSNGCSACHTLSAANATGKVGPDLDNLVSYAKTAKQPLEPFVHQSIVDPNAYIQPGYPKNVMPDTFGQSLTKEQLDHLVTFLVQSAQKSGNK